MTTHPGCNNTSLLECRALFEQRAPLFPVEELRLFVQSYFARRQEFLDIIEKKSSPLYVLESAVLQNKSREFQAAFTKHLENVSFYYAVKSNNHPDVAGNLLKTGLGLDVSSGIELQMAVDLGARDVVFSGPGKTEAELEFAVCEADRLCILIDSFSELAKVGEIAARKKRMVRVGVRLTTSSDGLWRKFGIVKEKLPLFIETASQYKWLDFQGIQFHTSWNLTPQAQISFISSLAETLRLLPESALAKIVFIDIGGGYWVPQGEWLQEAGTESGLRKKAFSLPVENENAKHHYRLPVLPLAQFAEKLGRAIREHLLSILPSCRICCEPGRWLCHDAMHLLLKVIDKKDTDLVITDAGTNAIGWERFETDYFPVLNLSRPALVEKPCHILGSLCTPHDVWGYGYWGEDIQEGDILLIPTQGAYTYSLRQHFIKPLPKVVTI